MMGYHTHLAATRLRMQLKTILNRVERHKSFVYGEARWTPCGDLEVDIEPRANGRALCSGCGKPAPGYDRLPVRRFEFVPLWGLAVHLVYAMRRVQCSDCGVRVERVPWAEGKCTLTKSYCWFLARWAKRMSWSETARVFGTSWDSVFRAAKCAVSWGLVHRETHDIKSIGVDEVAWQRGASYLTVVYQIDAGMKRLLWVGRERTEQTLNRFFQLFELDLKKLEFAVSDMWKPYVNSIRCATDALHVLDRFHIAKQMNLALDVIRADESRRMAAGGLEPLLKHTRWCLLKRPENLTDAQTVKLSDLVRYNLRTVRAYLLKEDFQRFWDYSLPGCAQRFLREWCTRAMRSRIKPLQAVARTLRRREDLLMNWFRAKGAISAGIVEGMNHKLKLTMRKGYGFRTYEAVETALYHQLGSLPEPEGTHRFC
jgi:transposase